MRSYLAAALAAGLGATAASAGPLDSAFTSAIFFGDSLTDNGNLPAPFRPQPPYFDGRFSNGPVYSDLVVDGYSDEETGNYAFGGATTRDGVSDSGDRVPNFDEQIDLFLFEAGGGAVIPGARPLATAWLGANNLFAALASQGVGLLFDDPAAEAAAAEAATSAAADIGDGIQRLIDSTGIRDFLVFNLPDLGQTPRIATSGLDVQDARDLTIAFNDALVAELGGLTGPAVSVTTIDVFEIFDEAIAGTVLPSLTNTTDPCFEEETVCATPDTFLFWDEVHPTAVVHAELADQVAAALAPIPVPPALPLIAMGILSLTWLRRRQAG